MGSGNTQRRAPQRPSAAASLAVVLLLTGFQLTAVSFASTAAGAPAVDDPTLPPGSQAVYTPPEIDGNSSGLRMRDGAQLAASRVLDIVSIVETEGGEERREETTTSLKFALQAEVLFGRNSADLSPLANSRVAAIVAEIKRNKPGKVRVFGFTDNLGSYQSGRVLSKKRADAVHGVLSEQLNDGTISYEVRGYSEDYPIADNSTEDGRRKNRRVEVSFPTSGGG
ncbi:OmpA family protein [Streptomyces sp. CAU 1734]|uniref:OmpA family protein n=1 Tax=Streptomyces sp. CAU 1734 TaxID=3140360 RepID=UPI0032600ED6